jgi:hypothetical protein
LGYPSRRCCFGEFESLADSFAAGINHNKREVNDFACGTKPRRGPPAALPGADVWRHAWFDGAHCPSAANQATKRPTTRNFVLGLTFYEHSEQARAPHTKGPRGLPRCGALNLLQKPLHQMVIQKKYCSVLVEWALTNLLHAPASTAQHSSRARRVYSPYSTSSR